MSEPAIHPRGWVDSSWKWNHHYLPDPGRRQWWARNVFFDVLEREAPGLVDELRRDLLLLFKAAAASVTEYGYVECSHSVAECSIANQALEKWLSRRGLDGTFIERAARDTLEDSIDDSSSPPTWARPIHTTSGGPHPREPGALVWHPDQETLDCFMERVRDHVRDGVDWARREDLVATTNPPLEAHFVWCVQTMVLGLSGTEVLSDLVRRRKNGDPVALQAIADTRQGIERGVATVRQLLGFTRKPD